MLSDRELLRQLQVRLMEDKSSDVRVVDWAKVSAIPPPQMKFVLVCGEGLYPGAPRPISIGRWDGRNRNWDILGDGEGFIEGDVIWHIDSDEIVYWKRLPNPPL